MHRQSFILSISIFSILLAGCAPKTPTNLGKYRMPTDIPSATSLTETAAVEIAARTPPQDCPVTVPQEPPFTPPPPYSGIKNDGYFWYGSNSLWLSLPQDGVWSGLPQDAHGYSQKLPWWREGYVAEEVPEPPLVVTGERLDAKAPPLEASTANGAHVEGIGSAMVMGAAFPTLGCWKITGTYEEAELSFVVWLAP